MLIRLKDAEKIALANHLAEQSVNAIEEYPRLTIQFTREQRQNIFKKKYKYYKQILDDTENY
jgi:hypothetical protein